MAQEVEETSFCLNLLVLPWPERLEPSSFTTVGGTLGNIPSSFGFFEYSAKHSYRSISTKVAAALKKAEKSVGEILELSGGRISLLISERFRSLL